MSVLYKGSEYDHHSLYDLCRHIRGIPDNRAPLSQLYDKNIYRGTHVIEIIDFVSAHGI